MKLVWCLVLTLLFIVLLLAIYILHAWYFPVNVVFYSSMLDAFLAALIMAILVFAWRSRRMPLNDFERLLLVTIWLLGGYAFAISVPTVIDRSLSFYLLEKLRQRGGGIELSSIESVLTDEYVKEHRLVDVRLTEQLESGNITIVDGCVKITPKGEQIATFSRFFRQHFLPKKRLLMGEYTDYLIDPFKNSEKLVDYDCE